MVNKHRIAERHIRQEYIVGGIDESGICCYAGPIYAACVILDPKQRYSKRIRDCKQLRQIDLVRAYIELINKGAKFGLGKATVREIDRDGTRLAIQRAMRRAYQACRPKPTYLLIDYHYIHGVHIPQWAIPNGDQKFLCVSAASIVAKYHRDRLMEGLHDKYPQYNWYDNKGGFDKGHERRIKKYGLTQHHRRSWCRRIIKEMKATEVRRWWRSQG